MQIGLRRLGSVLRPPWPVARLLVLFVVALAVPLVPLVIWEGYRVADEEQTKARKDYMVISEGLGDDVDEMLQSHITLLQTLAVSSALSTGNLAAAYVQAKTILEPAGLFAFLTDPAGQQLFNTRVSFGAPLPRSSSMIKPVFASKRPYVSDFSIDDITKRPVIFVSVPIMSGDELVYVFSLSVDVVLFQRILDRYKSFPPELTVYIADRKGVLIARFPRNDELVGKSMPTKEVAGFIDTTGRAQDLEEYPTLFARKISRIAGWSILSIAPENVANAKVFRGLLGYVAIIGLITIVGSMGAVCLGRMIVTPLHGLQKAAEALGKGEGISFAPSLLRETHAVEEALGQSAAQRKALEEQQALLLRELSHRSKNLLAVIQAVARQTLTASSSTAEAKQALSQRLEALARTYETLTRTPSYQAPIATIVGDELSAFSSRTQIDGPPLFLNPGAAQTMALVVHELATNAAKYGALSVPDGMVAVRWGIEANGKDGTFHFSWTESGGPSVKAPERSGFGSLLTGEIAAMQLGGEAAREFEKAGFRYRLVAPLPAVTAEA